MKAREIVSKLSLEEKAAVITGVGSMDTVELEEYGIKKKTFADGPHGVRLNMNQEDNCVMFPSVCAVAASWDKNIAERVGTALAKDCINHGVSMILAPGVNIKKNLLNGRNFEYFSEDPYLSGIMGAGYINGVQSMGVGACLKHLAANSQERFRLTQNCEIDERTLREIYLKAFEIIVKTAPPKSIMCAYNKLNAVYCSENKHLLYDILKKEWGYDGFVISDWGAVHNICHSLNAGLDMEKPENENIVELLKEGLKNGTVSQKAIDKACERILKFLLEDIPEKKDYLRSDLHSEAGKCAEQCMVLLKNENDILPLNSNKYKKIAVIGEYAVSPLTCGQGSAAVYPKPEEIEDPLKCIQELMPDIEFIYDEYYKKRELPKTMLWPLTNQFLSLIADSDAVMFFIGPNESADTENFDRITAEYNPNFEFFLNLAKKANKKTIVVMQDGGAPLVANWIDNADTALEMWFSGESGGSAVANVLCGITNPSGKLPETFPKTMRSDIDFPGTALTVQYSEKLNIGYRYYDSHPENICFPFGHGLSYTEFEYSDIGSAIENDIITISFKLKNIGDVYGSEVYQVYFSDPVSTVTKPIKELKYFEKISLQPNEEKTIKCKIPVSDLAYYNVSLNDWVVESGEYIALIGSSSLDIRLQTKVTYINHHLPYTIDNVHDAMIG